MVMRETPGRSVWPTVSDSMLKARRRNREAMRFSTPGLSSTYTTKVCSFSPSLIARPFHQRRGTANHGVQIRARRHHGIDRVFLLDAEIDERRAGLAAGHANGRQNL